jgi:DNA-binding beta-propeller fold protein YncE
MIIKHKSIYLLIFIFFALQACLSTKKTTVNSQKDEFVVYPLPPDTARFQYLTSISNSSDISKKRTSFEKFVTGEETVVTELNKPFGISVATGKIYVADVGSGGIAIIDLVEGSYELFIPTGKGKLLSPVNCCVDWEGNLYVADIGRRKIIVFDRNRKYLNSFGEEGEFYPTDVFALGKTIWVCSTRDHSIYKYNDAFKLINSFPELEPGDDGYLYQPKNIWVSDKKIYVSDFGGFQVKVFDHDGTYLSSIGSEGTSIGQFARPKGVAADKEGNVFVVDAAFQNVQIFNKDNQVLMFFGGPYQAHGDMYMPAGIEVDYLNLNYFKKYVDTDYDLKYLVLVTNQFGPDKLSIYGRIELKD